MSVEISARHHLHDGGTAPLELAAAGSAWLADEPGQRILWPHLQMYGGGCLSYSNAHSGLNHFIRPEGYISYHRFTHRVLARKPLHIAVGDPIAPTAYFPDILSNFLKANPSVVFLQASERFAEVLDRAGLVVNQLGIETDLDLGCFELKGKSKANLRHWINTARKSGIQVFEQDLMEIEEKEVSQLNADWLRSKGGHEMGLLTRRFEYRAQRDVRFFWARQDGVLIGFASFDPMYRSGRICGYYQDLVRRRLGVPHGASDLITITALESFQREGKEVLGLGLSPLSSLANDRFHAVPLIKRLFSVMHRHANFIYSFEGLEFHKKRYSGTERPVYVASTNSNIILQLRDLIAVIMSLGLL